MVPPRTFWHGRGAILTGFLARNRLYFSDHFRDKWKDRARANLEIAIGHLS